MSTSLLLAGILSALSLCMLLQLSGKLCFPVIVIHCLLQSFWALFHNDPQALGRGGVCGRHPI